jgi:hypothetical protein
MSGFAFGTPEWPHELLPLERFIFLDAALVSFANELSYVKETSASKITGHQATGISHWENIVIK